MKRIVSLAIIASIGVSQIGYAALIPVGAQDGTYKYVIRNGTSRVAENVKVNVKSLLCKDPDRYTINPGDSIVVTSNCWLTQISGSIQENIRQGTSRDIVEGQETVIRSAAIAPFKSKGMNKDGNFIIAGPFNDGSRYRITLEKYSSCAID